MPAGQAGAPPRQRRVRMPGFPPRVILNTIMSLAVFVLERRIRRALRAGAEAATPPE